MSSQYLKYIIGHLAAPFSALLILIIIAYLLIIFTKKIRLGKALMALSILTMYGLSTPYGAHQLLGPLEFKYSKFTQPKTPLAYIVVLGCAHSNAEYLPQSSRLAGCSHIRLMEALRLYRENPGSKVIFSGGGYGKQMSLAQRYSVAAQSLGVKQSDIIKEERPHNTAEEVAYISRQIVDAPTALVTSAAHMTRAMTLFEEQGLDLQPAPTDYLIRNKIDGVHLRYFIPEVKNMAMVNAAAHEYYGLWWINISQWFE